MKQAAALQAEGRVVAGLLSDAVSGPLQATLVGSFRDGKEAVGPSACLVPRPSRSGSIDDLSVAACLASGGGLSVGVRNSLKGRWRAEICRALIDSRIGRGFCVITG